MRVFTPDELAIKANGEERASKYLGVLVAARYARELNALPKEAVPGDRPQKKLTTQALEAFVNGEVEFTLVKRRRKSA
ncbi:MAG: hypothetical protein GX539_01155 [Candidatus Cloacimonetes bacterium]|jgi:DNA-directed RNA polymerase subunit K/omega|nr:hypothetical protein [Candidatus Cloacimonadota bacterium]